MRRNQKRNFWQFIPAIIIAFIISLLIGIFVVPEDFKMIVICVGTVILSFVGIFIQTHIQKNKKGGR